VIPPLRLTIRARFLQGVVHERLHRPRLVDFGERRQLTPGAHGRPNGGRRRRRRKRWRNRSAIARWTKISLIAVQRRPLKLSEPGQALPDGQVDVGVGRTNRRSWRRNRGCSAGGSFGHRRGRGFDRLHAAPTFIVGHARVRGRRRPPPRPGRGAPRPCEGGVVPDQPALGRATFRHADGGGKSPRASRGPRLTSRRREEGPPGQVPPPTAAGRTGGLPLIPQAPPVPESTAHSLGAHGSLASRRQPVPAAPLSRRRRSQTLDRDSHAVTSPRLAWRKGGTNRERKADRATSAASTGTEALRALAAAVGAYDHGRPSVPTMKVGARVDGDRSFAAAMPEAEPPATASSVRRAKEPWRSSCPTPTSTWPSRSA